MMFSGWWFGFRFELEKLIRVFIASLLVLEFPLVGLFSGLGSGSSMILSGNFG